MADRFVDTSVLLIAVGGDHPARHACREFLASCRTDGVRLHASVETVQEFLFHRLRRTARNAALEQAKALTRALVLHPFDEQVWLEALDLVERAPVRGRDAIIVATALQAGFGEIVSLDHDFDVVPGLTRVEP